jgi:hypothetical protein
VLVELQLPQVGVALPLIMLLQTVDPKKSLQKSMKE